MKDLKKNLPHFICIGAQRAGTTWLHACLNEHPEVFVPQEKELHFFDRFFDQGLEFYKEYFSPENRGSAAVWGEITPNYYQETGALERIRDAIPNVKIIYILREPVSRAFSQYQLYMPSQFAKMSFEQVINTQPVVTDLSMQGKHLQRVYSLFDKKQVLILFYDDLSASPQILLNKVYSFLGVDASFVPSHINKRINRVVLPGLQEKFRHMKLGWLIDLVKASPFSEWIKESFHHKLKVVEKDPFQEKMKDAFEQDIQLIERQLDISLSKWRKIDARK